MSVFGVTPAGSEIPLISVAGLLNVRLFTWIRMTKMLLL